MEKIRSELMCIAGINMLCVSFLDINDIAASLLFWNGVWFCIRSIVLDTQI